VYATLLTKQLVEAVLRNDSVAVATMQLLPHTPRAALTKWLVRPREYKRQHGQNARAQDREDATEKCEQQQEHRLQTPQPGSRWRGKYCRDGWITLVESRLVPPYQDSGPIKVTSRTTVSVFLAALSV
jgi:hypothetical protein